MRCAFFLALSMWVSMAAASEDGVVQLDENREAGSFLSDLRADVRAPMVGEGGKSPHKAVKAILAGPPKHKAHRGGKAALAKAVEAEAKRRAHAHHSKAPKVAKVTKVAASAGKERKIKEAEHRA